ncbi:MULTISPECIES: hypothetical protein [unclassified Moorena]|uniref:hypothetical protein n=1 Tax=unclassified Moorena TaxID=2683338 RepID=UPI0013B958E8|nr:MULTISPECIES: hypothetical protein [unclassified Moorena]NEO50199.1 hypothetical protein [Moorena sp. SIO4A3]NEP20744.1 hypothetical protein [Moorena sp. SIO3I6]NEQ60767.1 hypothetical protein [Moorena sp. SIO4A1]NEQ81083.1 hypothetical protein [Moorena sp. SIO2I5]
MVKLKQVFGAQSGIAKFKPCRYPDFWVDWREAIAPQRKCPRANCQAYFKS